MFSVSQRIDPGNNCRRLGYFKMVKIKALIRNTSSPNAAGTAWVNMDILDHQLNLSLTRSRQQALFLCFYCSSVVHRSWNWIESHFSCLDIMRFVIVFERSVSTKIHHEVVISKPWSQPDVHPCHNWHHRELSLEYSHEHGCINRRTSTYNRRASTIFILEQVKHNHGD